MRSISKAEVSMKNHTGSNASTDPLEEKIRNRAYELYSQRKRGHGHDVEDWLDAEAELRTDDEPLPKPIAA